MGRFFSRSMFVLMLSAGLLPAADVSGIWAGQAPGRQGEKQDIAFQFKVKDHVLSGKMFGDEFDLPIEDGSIDGDQIRFTITVVNYYSGNRTQFAYTGKVKDNEIEFVRSRTGAPANEKSANGAPPEQKFVVTRIPEQSTRAR